MPKRKRSCLQWKVSWVFNSLFVKCHVPTGYREGIGFVQFIWFTLVHLRGAYTEPECYHLIKWWREWNLPCGLPHFHRYLCLSNGTDNIQSLFVCDCRYNNYVYNMSILCSKYLQSAVSVSMSWCYIEHNPFAFGTGKKWSLKKTIFLPGCFNPECCHQQIVLYDNMHSILTITFKIETSMMINLLQRC